MRTNLDLIRPKGCWSKPTLVIRPGFSRCSVCTSSNVTQLFSFSSWVQHVCRWHRSVLSLIHLFLLCKLCSASFLQQQSETRGAELQMSCIPSSFLTKSEKLLSRQQMKLTGFRLESIPDGEVCLCTVVMWRQERRVLCDPSEKPNWIWSSIFFYVVNIIVLYDFKWLPWSF